MIDTASDLGILGRHLSSLVGTSLPRTAWIRPDLGPNAQTANLGGLVQHGPSPVRRPARWGLAVCLVGSSCPRGRCRRPVLRARSPRRADEPSRSGERRGLMTADILG